MRLRRGEKPYYGWYITLTLALTETISWGIIYYAFSVFLAPMEADLGWSRSELTGGFSLGLLVMGFMAFPVGMWIDRHGARLLMTAGSIGASLLVIGWSLVASLPAFYLIWVGLGVCAAMILYEPAFAVIAQWFHQRRSAALTLVTFAAGLASTIFLPLSDVLLHHVGWRTAVLILGLFLAIITIPLHALILRRRPADMGLIPDGAVIPSARKALPVRSVSLQSALRGRAFWLFTLGFCLASLSAAAVRLHFIPLLIAANVDASTAALAAGAIGITQVAGRVVFAPLDHRFSSSVIVVGIFALQSAAMAFLLVGQSPLLVGAFILIFGAAQGAATLARPSILAELYGTSHYARISSIMAIFLTPTSTSAPLGASLVYDRFGSYDLVLWIVLVIALASTLVVFIANRYLIRNPTPAAET